MKQFNNLKYLLVFVSMMISLSGCFYFPDQKVAEGIAIRLGVTPSWDAIRDHLSYYAFKPGMTREETHKVLDKVGPWIIDLRDSADDQPGWNSDAKQWVYRENIHFTERSTLQKIGYWSFSYNINDILVYWEWIDLY